jgi:hypothetical protein
MLRYDLDKLGWYEFEGLIQSLLKAQLGLGIEAWGGSKDQGRDAYFPYSLLYPGKRMRKGPFLFQCKFVDGANAAGARPQPLVLDAVRAECAEIMKRSWPTPPTVYTLFTNAKLSPNTRNEINKLIIQVLPRVQVITQGGSDLCALLDNTPKVARAFPQFLGLRNLEDMLRGRVNADILARSESAIKEAEELADIFVPVAAYRLALDKLGEHNFVILEGMPEMGKTAIGRMIALTKINEGWVARECRKPDDFLREYQFEEKQIFIADDFFGRTEYDPARVSLWQDDFPSIYRKLDANHWLVFTSRMHLLKIAEQTLDVSGLNKVFPRLGEVTVDAGLLNQEEKARILYRHAKNAGLTVPVKEIVKSQAALITNNEYFTPERIRRLIHEWLPKEIEPQMVALSTDDLGRLIRANLKDPTKGMHVTFERLPVSHKWMLFALVEVGLGSPPQMDGLRRSYEALCPEIDHQPFDKVVEQLSEAFVNKVIKGAKTEIKWIHPSAMDLVIDEFARSEKLRTHYLAHCDVHGIQLATSIGGGAKGTREVPLLVKDRDWKICARRAIELGVEGKAVLQVLLNNYVAMLKAEATAESDHRLPSPARMSLEQLLFDNVLPAIYQRSQTGQYEWTAYRLKQFYQAREFAPKYIPTVDPQKLFFEVAGVAKKNLAGEPLAPSDCEEFQQLVSLLESYDPSFLRKPNIKKIVMGIIEKLSLIGEGESSDNTYEFDDDDVGEMEREIERLEGLSGIYKSLSCLSFLSKEISKQLSIYSSVFEVQASDLDDAAREVRERAPAHDLDYDYGYAGSGGKDIFSITKLFSDL